MYKAIIRPILFSLSPERAHHFTMNLFKFLMVIPGMKPLFKSWYTVKHPSLEREVFGIKFPNPVGLAAGFDKNADFFEQIGTLGFGFVEIGTITPVGQPGNPQPRMFRLPADQGLINRMGFNNHGVEAAIENLKNRPKNLIVGGNIGKNKVTPNEEALNDYKITFEALFPYVDYFVVNVSSPNTPGLRALQDKEPLAKILHALQDLNKSKPKEKPILLKIAPDLTNNQLDDIIDLVKITKISGVIATNTTIDRTSLTTQGDITKEAGGLSGAPVRSKSTQIIKYLHTHSNGSFPIIGVGGIFTGKDAKEKLEAGASLVQVYTGFIYEGPAMVKKINSYLLK